MSHDFYILLGIVPIKGKGAKLLYFAIFYKSTKLFNLQKSTESPINIWKFSHIMWIEHQLSPYCPETKFSKTAASSCLCNSNIFIEVCLPFTRIGPLCSETFFQPVLFSLSRWWPGCTFKELQPLARDLQHWRGAPPSARQSSAAFIEQQDVFRFTERLEPRYQSTK